MRLRVLLRVNVVHATQYSGHRCDFYPRGKYAPFWLFLPFSFVKTSQSLTHFLTRICTASFHGQKRHSEMARREQHSLHGMGTLLCRSSIEVWRRANQKILGVDYEEFAPQRQQERRRRTQMIDEKKLHELFLPELYPTFLLKGLVPLGERLLNFSLEKLFLAGYRLIKFPARRRISGFQCQLRMRSFEQTCEKSN